VKRRARTPARATVSLNRALSKLGILSRAQATEAIRSGRVAVDGRVVRDPSLAVVPERARIDVDGVSRRKEPWRTILFHKPTGVVTTRHDPEGRPTIYDVLGDAARGLIAVGRLDLATSGLLILTNDTQLANRLTDPRHAVPRVYIVTVRGEVTDDERARLERGIESSEESGEERGGGVRDETRGERLRAAAVTVRKTSRRESHLTIELREGKNREVRRLCEAIGHEVTRLKRIRFGSLELGALRVGGWRELTPAEIRTLMANGSMARELIAES
jgi:23S rRNA pseudouridine2605 synthase